MQESANSHPSPESMSSTYGSDSEKVSRTPTVSDMADNAVIKDEMQSVKAEVLSVDAQATAANGTNSPTSDQSNSLSRKRRSSANEEACFVGKKRKLEQQHQQKQIEASTRQPPTPRATPEPTEEAEIVRNPFFDDAPSQLLERSCALVLQKVGYDGATKNAMEALLSEVNTYMLRLFSYINESMRAARRTHPTVSDFEYAMRYMGLTSRHLRPHTKPPLDPSLLQFEYPPSDQVEPVPETPAKLLGPELSGAADKRSKNYIPPSFPAFPSKHTYKSTSLIPERERDTRKIREKATIAARNAEEALRRLVKVSKVGGHGRKRGTENNERKRTRNLLWEKTMADLTLEQPTLIEEQSISVDAGRQFWRGDASKRRA